MSSKEREKNNRIPNRIQSRVTFLSAVCLFEAVVVQTGSQFISTFGNNVFRTIDKAESETSLSDMSRTAENEEAAAADECFDNSREANSCCSVSSMCSPVLCSANSVQSFRVRVTTHTRSSSANASAQCVSRSGKRANEMAEVERQDSSTFNRDSMWDHV